MVKTKNRNWAATARPLVLAAFAAFILVAAIRHHTSAIHEASLHAYCPFGAIASLWPLITTGRLARTLHTSGAVLGAGVLLSAFVVGGAFCGWICPLGALHDALDWIRRKLRIQEIKPPRLLDRALRFGRYAMLIGIIFATAVTTDRLWFGGYDPYHAIFALDWIFEPNLAEHWRAYLVSVAVIAGGLFIPRLWCRYLCPLGGLLSLVQRISPIKIRRDANACVDCGRCDSVCPTRLDVATGGAVSTDCIMCLRCVEECPAPGALETALPGYQTLATTTQGERIKKVNRWVVPVVALFLLFGSVMVGKAFGWWVTTGHRLAEIEQASPADIRGSSTPADISEAFGIPVDGLLELLEIPADTPPETKLKDLAEFIAVGTVRGLVAEHLGLPWEWEEGEEHETSEADTTPSETERPGPAPLPQGETLDAVEIKGRMTLAEVSDGTGMPLDLLYEKLGLDSSLDSKTPLKDLSDSIEGFEVSVVQEIVGEYHNQ